MFRISNLSKSMLFQTRLNLEITWIIDVVIFSIFSQTAFLFIFARWKTHLQTRYTWTRIVIYLGYFIRRMRIFLFFKKRTFFILLILFELITLSNWWFAKLRFVMAALSCSSSAILCCKMLHCFKLCGICSTSSWC